MKGFRYRSKPNWLLRLMMLALLAVFWRVYGRRTPKRIPSPEGIDDPQIADAFEWVTEMPPMRWMRHFVSSQATALKHQGEAIDLGCGAGQLVLEMAHKAPGLHVTGIDLSDTLLEEARHSAQRAGMADKVDFRLGNVEKIPFSDQSLDLVISTASLHHWMNPVMVLDEIERVLKPGGAYYIFDLRRDMAIPFYMIIWFATQFIVPAALHQVNEPMGSRNASYSPQELAGLAQQSKLSGGQVTVGPLWLVLAGRKSQE